VLREFLWWSTASEQIEIDPEAMTKQERLSRMLHAPKQNATLPTSGPIFEHFIVVGLPNATAKRPEVLFHYPTSNPVMIPGLADFCFPSGIQPTKLRKTKSNSNLLQVLYSQSYNHEQDNAFVFMLTTIEKELLYGVCVVKHESVRHKPSFFPPADEAEQSSDGPADVAAPRCYCLVTRFPFLELHFDLIYSLLDLEYISSLSTLQGVPSPRDAGLTPSLTHCQSLPALQEKKRKKIRLRSRTVVANKRDESNASTAQDQSPFPGIPLHTVHKKPVPLDHLSDADRGERGWDHTTNATTAKVEVVLNTATSSREHSGRDRLLPSHSSEIDGRGERKSEDSEVVQLNSSEVAAHIDEAATGEKSSADDTVGLQGRESGSEGRASPPPCSSPRKTTKEWKLKALTGRGIVKDDPEKEAPTTDRSQANARKTLSEDEEESESEGGNGEEKNQVLQVLGKYLGLDIPEPDQTINFFVHHGLPALRFKRPAFHDQEYLLSNWSLPLTLYLLSTDNLLTLITACLLEKKVILHSSNVRFLSASVLSIMPLLRPFVYQSVMIPILPEMLLEFLEAPVPFVLGLTSAPPKHSFPKDVKEFVIVDLDNDKVTAKDTLPSLPLFKELRKKLKPSQKILLSGRQHGKAPYVPSEEQRSCCQATALTLQTFFSSFFSNFRTYCLCDKTDSEKPITVFLKDSFLNDQPRASKPFLSRFLETQIFFHFCDQRLRELDGPSESFAYA